MRVALTGGAGFTGAYLRAALRDAGHEPVLLEADLTDAPAVEEEVERTPFDALVHLAGEAFVASGNWRRFYEVNHLGTLHLVDVLARRRPGMRCILASSAQVYGRGASGLLNEDHPTRPANHYACSKLAMEWSAGIFRDRLDIVITRPFNYTGVGQPNHYVVPKIVSHFQRKAASIELGNIDVRRDFGDVRAVAQAYAALVSASSLPPILNISTGCASSIRDVLRLAREITGHSLAITVNPNLVRPDDDPLLVGDNGRLQDALPDWRPLALEETVAWMLTA